VNEKYLKFLQTILYKSDYRVHNPVQLYCCEYEGYSKSFANRYTENTQSIGI